MKKCLWTAVICFILLLTLTLTPLAAESGTAVTLSPELTGDDDEAKPQGHLWLIPVITVAVLSCAAGWYIGLIIDKRNRRRTPDIHE